MAEDRQKLLCLEAFAFNPETTVAIERISSTMALRRASSFRMVFIAP